MKKDVAFAIALIVAGGFGLVFPSTFNADADPAAAKPAHVLRVESGVEGSSAIKCSRDAESKANLFHKVSVAFSDLDSFITLQSM